jgi:UDP-glucose 4-epimerase
MNEGAFYTQVFTLFYNNIKQGIDITIFGDGTQTMDLIHASDIARANLLGLKSNVTGEFLNVGSGRETTVEELAHLMMDTLGKKVNIIYKDGDSQKVKNRRSDTTKIAKLLGFTPTINPREGISQYIKTNDNKNPL